ncbi:phosphatase PAP2 family protein [Hymenobacter properus]|uniref:Phosphatase PAP2 family protein n=1 Tax=Hymenobacter properus TaxID=2791026 RepID=A0A931FJM7_9BACT|nr:phosphatase PAP2 family protein [Hymenobacter properus]MBF9140700.1 phosphatase PAP2 family protein [Hymenobacter properus]MBR7719508.1 phosphatase PAP2 family protein [Microvirga sp. SRT04]
MTLRQFLLFTAVTLPGCVLLILFLDQPITLFVHRYTGWAVPFFSAYTAGADTTYDAAVSARVLGLPALYVALLLLFVLGRWVLKRSWGTLALVVLLTHIASQGSSNVLKGTVHRLRPEVLFSGGYPGTGLWATGPHNDSFPSTHTAIYFSLFWPLALAFPRWRVPLLVLPGLIMLGRLVMGAHYPSDVWFSAWLVVAYTFLFGLLGKPRPAAR